MPEWKRAGQLGASVGLLAVDLLWRGLSQAATVCWSFVPWLASLVAMGVSLGAIVIGAAFVLSRYSEILAGIHVEWAVIALLWGVALLLGAMAGVGWLVLRASGNLGLSFSRAFQDAASQIERLANAAETRRRPRSATPKPATEGQGEFVPWSDELAFLNEQATEMRARGITEEMIRETLSQARTVQENPQGGPLG